MHRLRKGLQRNLEVRQLVLGEIVEVGVEAAQDGLMADDENVFLSFELEYDGFEPVEGSARYMHDVPGPLTE